AGKLKFHLHGDKLHGGWTLVRSHMRGSGDKEQWLLIKERDSDAHSESEFDVLDAFPDSVMSDARGARGIDDKARKHSSGRETGKGGARAGVKRTAADARHTRAGLAKPNTTGRTKHAAHGEHPDIVATRNSESLRELAGNPSIEGAVK